MSREADRLLMVGRQLQARGIRDQRVLDAMERVPRHRFVPERYQDRAYDDCPLPIGEGQTISQPYMVASMTEALRLQGGERVLEVGTGSGYQAAVLGCLADQVFSLERHRALVDRARETLAELGYDNVTVLEADGTLGLPEEAPFQAILVTAGSPSAPPPLIAQLAPGARLVVPVGDRLSQVVEIHHRRGDGEIRVQRATPCRFVDLIGQHGWGELPH